MKRFTLLKSIVAMCALLSADLSAQCTFTGLNPIYCVNSATSALTTTATGGFFSGPGVIGSTFNPSIAGPGTHSITYGICSPTYSIITGASALFNPIPTPTTGSNAETGVNLTDDSETGALNIGFSFKFFCNTYTTFYISSNGFIFFSGTGNGCCSGQFINNTAAPNDLIALTWEDFNPGQGGTISYATIGTAPNRILIVKFNNVPHFGSGGGPLTSQVQLYEGSNIIEIHTTTMISDGGTHTQGIENANGTAAYALVSRNATSYTITNDMVRFAPLNSCSSTQTTIVSPSTISVVGTNSICSGASTTLTATGNTTYSWNTSSNSNSIVVSPTVTTTYAVAGTNSYNCIANSAITVTVDMTPTVVAVSSSTSNGICPGQTVSLTGSGATTYTWTGGVVNGVPFNIGTQSTYTVTGSNACGDGTAVVSVSVHPLPTVSGVASQPTICSNNPVNITGIGNGVTYSLSNGVGSGVNFFPSTTANYTITATSALGCTNTAVTGVTVVTTPQAPPLASPPLICIGSSATLSSSGATNYTWTIPSLPANNNSSLVVNPSSSTIYTLTKANANCVNTQTLQLYVNNLPPVFAVSNPTLVCAGKPSTLTGAGALTYTWTSPTNFTFTGGSPIVTPLVNSIYTVSASDGTCINTTTVAVATNPNPTVTIVATSTSICFGENVSLTAGGAASYVWSAPILTTTPTNTTIAEQPLASTLYQVTGMNAFSCTTAINQVVIVRTTPTLNVQTTKPLVCSGAPSGLTVTAIGSGPFSYTWDANAGSATTSVSIVNPMATNIYTVTGLNSVNCTSTGTILVSVFLPTFAVNSPTSSCLGGTINLMASGANTYTWVGGGSFATYPVSPTGPTVYVVSATSGSLGVNCVSVNSVIVAIYQNPTVTAVASRTQICRGEVTNVNGFGAVSYQWNTSQTGSTVPVNPNSNTTYTVTGTDQNGCLGTATVLVKTSTCVGLDKLAAATGLNVYPNPNVGAFTVSSSTPCEITLYNEIGQLIKTSQLNESNGYKCEFNSLDPGVYLVTVNRNGNLISEKIVVTR